MTDLHSMPVRCELPVFYATTEGQTRKIAETLAMKLCEKGFESRAFDVAGAEARRFNWSRTRAAVLGASLHIQHHQRAAAKFVRLHAAELNRYPSAFFSVSLSTASQHAAEKLAARQLAEDFPAALGWHPSVIVCLAGRLAYTGYGVLTRFVLKRIARQQGAPTDTSRDYEFTNWEDVAALAERMAGMLEKPTAKVVA